MHTATPSQPNARAYVGALVPAKATRTRTCVGCHARAEANVDLFRVFVRDGEIQVDLCNKSSGRGAWLHPSTRCIQAACRGALQRSLGCTVSAADLVSKLRGRAMQMLESAATVFDVSMEVL